MKKLLCTVIAAVMLVSVCVTASAAGLDELLRDYVGVTYDGHSEDQLARWMLAQAEIDWIYRGYWGDCYEAIRYNGQYVTDAIYLDSHGIEWKTDGVVDEAAMARLRELTAGKQAEIDRWFMSEYLGLSLYDDDVILVVYENSYPSDLKPESFPYLDVEDAEAIMPGQHPIIKIKLNPKEGGWDIFEEIEKLLAGSEYPIRSAEPNYHSIFYCLDGMSNGAVARADFDDVRDNRYYSRAVSVLSALGIVKGVSKDQFAPEAVTTRAMMAEILYRIDTMFGRASAEAGKPEGYQPFTDVKGKWYWGAADWARLTGVVEGYPDGSFRGDQPITRAEAATMLYRYFKFEGLDPADADENGVMRFNDGNKIPSWAKEAVNYLWKKGMMVGVSEESFDPKGMMNRAMIATVAYRVVTEYGKVDDPVVLAEQTGGITDGLGLNVSVNAWIDKMPGPPGPSYNKYHYVVTLERKVKTGEEMPDIAVQAEIDGHTYLLERDKTGLKDYSSYRISLEDREYLAYGSFQFGGSVVSEVTFSLGGQTETRSYVSSISVTY